MLLIESIDTPSRNVIAFWDSGSTLALISKDCAARNNLRGVPVSYELITVGGKVSSMNTTLYEVELIDRDGDVHKLKMYEIDDICGEINSTPTDSFVKYFPSVTKEEIARPRGKIDMLIGMDYAGLHPRPIEYNKDLVLYQSMFGTGKIIGGAHDNVALNERISSMVQQCALGRVANARVLRHGDIDFFSAEEFGVSVPPRCKRCQGCKDCQFETHQLSRNEQKELDVIRDNMKLDPTINTWTAKYPYKCDPAVLHNNKMQVVSITEKTEKRLAKDKQLEKQYHEQIYDLLRRGVLAEITEKDEKSYDGPVFYITHHEVFKPGSSSTPVRLVVNSSLKF